MTLQQRLEELYKAGYNAGDFRGPHTPRYAAFEQATTAIEQDINKAMPKKRPDAVKRGEIIPFDGNKKVDMDWLRKCQDAGYNQALEELRTKLHKYIKGDE